jgi:hypothetical protein
MFNPRSSGEMLLRLSKLVRDAEVKKSEIGWDLEQLESVAQAGTGDGDRLRDSDSDDESSNSPSDEDEAG